MEECLQKKEPTVVEDVTEETYLAKKVMSPLLYLLLEEANVSRHPVELMPLHIKESILLKECTGVCTHRPAKRSPPKGHTLVPATPQRGK